MLHLELDVFDQAILVAKGYREGAVTVLPAFKTREVGLAFQPMAAPGFDFLNVLGNCQRGGQSGQNVNGRLRRRCGRDGNSSCYEFPKCICRARRVCLREGSARDSSLKRQRETEAACRCSACCHRGFCTAATRLIVMIASHPGVPLCVTPGYSKVIAPRLQWMTRKTWQSRRIRG
jgi:hypothetical protein